MILYADASSLVKLYVAEPGSELVARWVAEAELVVTSRVSYAETLAALARRWREGALAGEQFEALRSALTTAWADQPRVEVDERRAGDLAVRHALRGFDAIHVAAALTVRDATPEVTVAFTSFDARQLAAARAEGFAVLGPPAEASQTG